MNIERSSRMIHSLCLFLFCFFFSFLILLSLIVIAGSITPDLWSLYFYLVLCVVPECSNYFQKYNVFLPFLFYFHKLTGFEGNKFKTWHSYLCLFLVNQWTSCLTWFSVSHSEGSWECAFCANAPELHKKADDGLKMDSFVPK